MATLVLSAAGQYFGGPIGAFVGAQVGQVIDREVLFKPKGRDGPRLTELAVQTSSYGTQIPKVFGRMRVAGSVIWSTDLIEHRHKEGGKGRPSSTSYSYTASFAVALSARAAIGVARIWADGKLLRGAAGDFKVKTGFRLHPGDEDQAADPLIAAAEGSGLAPAHRGIAYAVFEDMALAEFGNRIPSLTFELIADAAPVTTGAILAEIGGGLIGDAGMQALDGFAASGASVRAVAETLAGAEGGWFRSDNGVLALASGSGDATEIEDAGASVRERASARGNRSIAAADGAPRTLSLTHYDPARDYQIGVQRAVRPGAGQREARLELPAVLAASAAKTIAETALARMDVERERRSVALDWGAMGTAPGERVRIGGVPGVWRVEGWSLEAMVVTLDCVALAPAALAVEASGGRVLPAPDVVPGETIVQAFELPVLDGTLVDVPRLLVAAAGTAPGWRRAALLLSIDGGMRWNPAGATALPAAIGTVVVPPGIAAAAIEDRIHGIEVALAHAGMVLGDSDPGGLDAGANLALVGEELLQFAHAEPLGGNRWRLSGLWRGRRGSEAAIGTQVAGDRFVLLAAEALAAIPLPDAVPGMVASLLAEGPGDAEGVRCDAAISGVSMVPPCPVHLAAERLGDGSVMLGWVRRSRSGWRWADGVDAPLGEERERYRVTVTPDSGAAWTTETAVPALVVDADRIAGGAHIGVQQIGSHGLSTPADITLLALD